MKKLIFLLFPVFSYGQITITRITPNGGGEANCSGVGVLGIQHNNIPLTENKLYIAIVFSDSTGVYGSNIGSTSHTWDTVSQSGNSTRRIAVYRCMPTSSTTTDDPIVTFPFGNFPNFIAFHIYEITGVPLGANGANAIQQVVTDGETSANPDITMAALTSQAGVMMAVASSDVGGGSPESGWTEGNESNCTTYPGSAYINSQNVIYRVPTTDNTPTITRASGDWVGVALEFKRSGRRAVIIN